MDVVRDKLQAEPATVHAEADGDRVAVGVEAPNERAARDVVERVLNHNVTPSVRAHFASTSDALRIHSR